MNIWEFKTNAFLAVDDFQHEAEDKGSHTKASEHHERGGIVELCRVGNTRIRLVEHLADEQWEKPETNVLNPCAGSIVLTGTRISLALSA